jgi:rhamnosyltransferase subunit B
MSLRIVITSFGSYGDLNPYVALAQGLRERGHRPVLAIQPHFRPVVEAAGLAFRPVRPDLDPGDPDWSRRALDPRRGSEFLIRRLLMPRIRQSYEDLLAATRGADLLLSHPLTYAGPVVAEVLGIRWAASVLAPLSLFSTDDPPLFVPSPALAALHRRWPRALGPLIPLAKRLVRPWTAPVAALRAGLGLPPGGHPIYEGQFSPMLNLAMFPRVLAGPRADWPPNTVVTGAALWDGAHGTMSPELERFLDAGPPPVVFTLGSSAVGSAGSAGFYRESLAAVARLGVRAVLLTGPDSRNRPGGRLPEGVLALPGAPHGALFARASAVVHQVGAGTLAQALRAGRPMLLVPHAHDQPDNAARTERLGIARTLYPSRYSARRVEHHLAALLGDPAYARRAAAVAQRVAAEDGVRDAADALEALAADRRPANPL